MLHSWIFLLFSVELLCSLTEAAVANPRTLDASIWGNRMLLNQNYAPLKYTSQSGENQVNPALFQQLGQLRTGQVPKQAVPNLEPYFFHNGIIQPSYFTASQPVDQGTYMIASAPSQDFAAQTAVTAEINGADVTSPQSNNLVSPTTGSTIVGAPSDGVLGAAGQVLGSAQDTAVVESAGQLGPTLLQAQIPFTYQEPQLSYNFQTPVSQYWPSYPTSYQIPDGTVYPVAVDQYGRTVTNQELLQNPHLFSAFYAPTA